MSDSKDGLPINITIVDNIKALLEINIEKAKKFIQNGDTQSDFYINEDIFADPSMGGNEVGRKFDLNKACSIYATFFCYIYQQANNIDTALTEESELYEKFINTFRCNIQSLAQDGDIIVGEGLPYMSGYNLNVCYDGKQEDEEEGITASGTFPSCCNKLNCITLIYNKEGETEQWQKNVLVTGGENSIIDIWEKDNKSIDMDKLMKLLYKRKQLVFFIHSHINGFGHAVAFALELEEDDEPNINVCFCDPWRAGDNYKYAPLGGGPISKFIKKQLTENNSKLIEYINQGKEEEKERKRKLDKMKEIKSYKEGQEALKKAERNSLERREGAFARYKIRMLPEEKDLWEGLYLSAKVNILEKIKKKNRSQITDTEFETDGDDEVNIAVEDDSENNERNKRDHENAEDVGKIIDKFYELEMKIHNKEKEIEEKKEATQTELKKMMYEILIENYALIFLVPEISFKSGDEILFITKDNMDIFLGETFVSRERLYNKVYDELVKIHRDENKSGGVRHLFFSNNDEDKEKQYKIIMHLIKFSMFMKQYLDSIKWTEPNPTPGQVRARDSIKNLYLVYDLHFKKFGENPKRLESEIKELVKKQKIDKFKVLFTSQNLEKYYPKGIRNPTLNDNKNEIKNTDIKCTPETCHTVNTLFKQSESAAAEPEPEPDALAGKTSEGKPPKPEAAKPATPEGAKPATPEGATQSAEEFEKLISEWEDDLLKLYEGDDEVNPDPKAESYKNKEIQKKWNSNKRVDAALPDSLTKTIVELRTLIGLRESFKLSETYGNDKELEKIGLKSLLG